MRVDTPCHPPQVGGDDARRDPCGACVENSPDEAALNKSFHRCLRVCCSSRPARQRRRVLPHCATARTLGKGTEPQLSSRPPIEGDRHEQFSTTPSAAIRIPTDRPLKPGDGSSASANSRPTGDAACGPSHRRLAPPRPRRHAIASATLRRLRPLSNAVVATDPSTSCAASARQFRAPVAWRSAGVNVRRIAVRCTALGCPGSRRVAEVQGPMAPADVHAGGRSPGGRPRHAPRVGELRRTVPGAP